MVERSPGSGFRVTVGAQAVELGVTLFVAAIWYVKVDASLRGRGVHCFLFSLDVFVCLFFVLLSFRGVHSGWSVAPRSVVGEQVSEALRPEYWCRDRWYRG